MRAESPSALHARMRPEAVFHLGIDEVDKLSPQRWKVLGWLGLGMSRAEIRHELWICESTLEDHLAAIRCAFGARSTEVAVKTAQRMGLIS